MSAWTDLGLPLPNAKGYGYTRDAALVRSPMESPLPEQAQKHNSWGKKFSISWDLTLDELAVAETYLLQYGYSWFELEMVSSKTPYTETTSIHTIRLTENYKVTPIGSVFMKLSVSAESRVPDVRLDKYININATTQGILSLDDIQGGYDRGITITGYSPSDILRVSLPPGLQYTAWSMYGVPAYDPQNPNASGSKNHFYVLKSPDATAYEFFGTNGGLGWVDDPYNNPVGVASKYDGYEAARVGFITKTLTGASQYTFVIYDGLFTDNSGGLSILVSGYKAPCVSADYCHDFTNGNPSASCDYT